MHILTVSELAKYIQQLIASDHLLQDVWVEGEVSNVSRAASGHWYWTIKEGEAQIGVVCFRHHAARLATLPEHGALMLAHGQIRFWEGNGRIQLYVDFLRPAGVGLLHARFEELRARLAAEGLFDESRKRPLPSLPRRIGVVTSPTGAAFRDICTVLRRRYPLAEIILSPSLVQGDSAPDTLVEALYALYDLDVDVILVARGGGSLEDLWAFNEEIVARAIFASPVPVVTGVGHETDTTIVDYVADLRAPTPSAAAELVAPDIRSLAESVTALTTGLTTMMIGRLSDARAAVAGARQRLELVSPRAALRHGRQAVDGLSGRLATRSRSLLSLQQAQLHGLQQKLQALNPAATLARGYAAVTRCADGSLVTSPAQVRPGDQLLLRVRDGQFTARAGDEETCTE
ncbi:MAG: exodeoxyribonuclease 7 large subunit [Herpetosiphonaceae bacterium]|nr:MAG: exodeoxyribonuclease 7 large subunit [Herpetosiphonaceae bacterium]